MNFLAPLFLLGALAVAGPIVFHLVRRTTRERRLFSTVMFFPPSRPRLTRRSRPENLLLLFLRCLALGLLALGFARPFFRRAAPAAALPPQPRRVVVLVDTSASMRRAGLWEQARRRAASTLRALGPADQAALLVFNRAQTSLVSFEEWNATPAPGRAALALRRLSAAGPGWEEDRLGDALIRAAEMLGDAAPGGGPPGPREIVLISDLKAGSRLESLQGYDWPRGLRLELRPLKAEHPTNAGIQLVAAAPDADPLAPASIRVRVTNAADSAREQFRVGWGGTSAGTYIGPAVDVYVPPGQSRVVAVAPLARRADMREIVLQGDDEGFDNTAYAIPPQLERRQVLYLGSDSAGDPHGSLFFLERALPDNPHLSVKALARPPSAAPAAAELGGAALVVATDRLGDGAASALRGAMLAGKTVLFAVGSAAAGPSLAELLGLPRLNLEDVRPPDYALFGQIDFSHPIFSAFADPPYSDFSRIHIWGYRRLRAGAIPGARVLARFDRGDPALVEAPVGRGRLLVLLTRWSPADSELAVSSKFVPLIASVLQYAGTGLDPASQFTVGDPIPLPADAAGPTTVALPGGGARVLPPGAAAFTGDAEPGIYSLRRGPRTWQVAVNLAPSESRTEPLPADELERYGAPGPPDPARERRVVQRQALLLASEAESRQKLWRWLLAATLLVLLGESALAGWTSRNSAGKPATP